jgi:hypothetical protein
MYSSIAFSSLQVKLDFFATMKFLVVFVQFHLLFFLCNSRHPPMNLLDLKLLCLAQDAIFFLIVFGGGLCCVILEVYIVSILNPFKKDVVIKITI